MNTSFKSESDVVELQREFLTPEKNDDRLSENTDPKDTTLIFRANSKKGFNFDYVIYFPSDMDTSEKITLLVEISNTGANDSLDHLFRHCIQKPKGQFILDPFIIK